LKLRATHLPSAVLLASVALVAPTPAVSRAARIDDDACSVVTSAKADSHQTDAADATDGCTYNFVNGEGNALFLIQPMPEFYRLQVTAGLQMGAHIEPITIGGICNGELMSIEGIPEAKPLYLIEFTCAKGYFVVSNQSSGLNRAALVVLANEASHTKFGERFLHLSPERLERRRRALAAQRGR
jgi:hypothetical protein